MGIRHGRRSLMLCGIGGALIGAVVAYLAATRGRSDADMRMASLNGPDVPVGTAAIVSPFGGFMTELQVRKMIRDYLLSPEGDKSLFRESLPVVEKHAVRTMHGAFFLGPWQVSPEDGTVIANSKSEIFTLQAKIARVAGEYALQHVQEFIVRWPESHYEREKLDRSP